MKALYWIIASFITIAGFSLIAAGAGILSKDTKNYYDKTETFENIHAVDLAIQSAEVEIVSDPEAENCVLELKHVTENMTYTQDGEKLRVEQKSEGHFNWFVFNNEPSKVIVTLPESQYKEIVVDDGSGSITTKGLTADSLNLHAGSGSVKLENIETDYQDVHTGSGSISLNQVKSRVSKIKSGSGSITFENTEFTEEASAECGSGTIRGKELVSDKTSFHTGSGSLKLENCTLTDETSAVLGSGSVTATGLTLNADLKIKTGSGGTTLEIIGDEADYIIAATLMCGKPDFEGIGGKKNADPHNIIIESGSGSGHVHFIAPENVTEATE